MWVNNPSKFNHEVITEKVDVLVVNTINLVVAYMIEQR